MNGVNEMMRRWCWLATLTTGLVALGCGSDGPPTYHVAGTVRLQDDPLPLGTVMFVPDSGPPAGPAPIAPDGTYELDAVEGDHAVQVVAMPVREGGRPDPTVEGGIDYTGVPEVKSLIPRKYNRFSTSGIRVTVAPNDQNQIDIDLE